MPILCVLLASIFWCKVNASQVLSDSVSDEAAVRSCKQVMTENSNSGTETRDLITLKQQRHSLRMRLLHRVRTPSISPPSGERRRKLEEDLSNIEHAIQEVHTRAKAES